MVVTLDSLRDSSVYKERAMRAVKAQRSVVAMGDAQGAWGSGGASGAAGVAQCAMFKETLSNTVGAYIYNISLKNS